MSERITLTRSNSGLFVGRVIQYLRTGAWTEVDPFCVRTSAGAVFYPGAVLVVTSDREHAWIESTGTPEDRFFEVEPRPKRSWWKFWKR